VFMEENHGFKYRVTSPAEMSGTILKLGKVRASGREIYNFYVAS